MERSEALAVLEKYKQHVRLVENDLAIDTKTLAQSHGEQVHAEVRDAMTLLSNGRGMYSHEGNFVRVLVRGLDDNDLKKGIDAQELVEHGIISPIEMCQAALNSEVSRNCRNLNALDRKAIASWLLSGARGVEGVEGGQGLQTLTGEVAIDITNTRNFAESVFNQINDRDNSHELLAAAVREGKQTMPRTVEQ